MEKLWPGIIAFVAEWALIPFEGFVVSAIWAWLISGLFGLPPLGLVGGIGLILLFRIIRGIEPFDIPEEVMKTENVIDHILARFVNSSIILLIGFFVHSVL